MATGMETVCITGGTGLIGSSLMRILKLSAYRVLVLSRAKSDDPDSILRYWDIDKGIIDPVAVENADYYVHLAGASVGEGGLWCELCCCGTGEFPAWPFRGVDPDRKVRETIRSQQPLAAVVVEQGTSSHCCCSGFHSSCCCCFGPLPQQSIQPVRSLMQLVAEVGSLGGEIDRIYRPGSIL